MLTVIEIAEKLNVSRDIAYGLVRFAEAVGALKPAGTRKATDKKGNADRGKPAHLYVFDDETVGALVGLLANLQPAAAEQPAQTETAPMAQTAVETPAAVDAPAF